MGKTNRGSYQHVKALLECWCPLRHASTLFRAHFDHLESFTSALGFILYDDTEGLNAGKQKGWRMADWILGVEANAIVTSI